MFHTKTKKLITNHLTSCKQTQKKNTSQTNNKANVNTNSNSEHMYVSCQVIKPKQK